jgi:hypothetical protein
MQALQVLSSWDLSPRTILTLWLVVCPAFQDGPSLGSAFAPSCFCLFELNWFNHFSCAWQASLRASEVAPDPGLVRANQLSPWQGLH